MKVSYIIIAAGADINFVVRAPFPCTQPVRALAADTQWILCNLPCLAC